MIILMKPASLILTLAIVGGQLFKLPLGGYSIGTFLDLSVGILILVGLLRIRFKLKTPSLPIKLLLIFIVIGNMSLALSPLKLNLTEFLFSFSYGIRLFSYTLLGWIIFSGGLNDLKKNIPNILFLSGVTIAILGLVQFLFIPDLMFMISNGWDPHYYRTVSTFFDPNFAGAFFVLTLLLIFQKKQLIIKPGRGIIILVFLALLTTFSRSSYLMFLVSFVTFSLVTKSIKFFLLSLVAFFILLGSFQIYTQVISKPRGIDRAKSASFRLDTWQQGFTVFQKNPVLGVGFNSYKFALDKYGLADEKFLSSRGSTSNDSSLLFVLSTTGITGLIFYLYFLISPYLFKNKDPLLIAALSGLTIHSFFSNSLFYPFILIWIILVISQTFLK